MGIVLAGGFIFLKERRQKMDIMKLTQMGVKSKSITIMNIINYIFVTILLSVITIIATTVAIDAINSIYTIELAGGIGFIKRFRILFTYSSIQIAIIASIVTFVICIIATTISTKISKR